MYLIKRKYLVIFELITTQRVDTIFNMLMMVRMKERHFNQDFQLRKEKVKDLPISLFLKQVFTHLNKNL